MDNIKIINNMKIAVPTRENVVDSHFGHCEFYTIYSINDKNEIINTEIIPSPQGCGCKSDIAAVLEREGVKVMLAGNMGGGALNVLSSHNIKVLRGCEGDVTAVVKSYLNNELEDSGVGCSSHSDGHSHSASDGHVCSH